MTTDFLHALQVCLGLAILMNLVATIGMFWCTLTEIIKLRDCMVDLEAKFDVEIESLDNHGQQYLVPFSGPHG